MIRTINDNHIAALKVEDDGSVKVVARATRKNPGTVWYVWYFEHRKDLTRNETPHARVSGKLPKDVQRRMLVQLLDLATH